MGVGVCVQVVPQLARIMQKHLLMVQVWERQTILDGKKCHKIPLIIFSPMAQDDSVSGQFLCLLGSLKVEFGNL